MCRGQTICGLSDQYHMLQSRLSHEMMLMHIRHTARAEDRAGLRLRCLVGPGRDGTSPRIPPAQHTGTLQEKLGLRFKSLGSLLGYWFQLCSFLFPKPTHRHGFKENCLKRYEVTDCFRESLAKETFCNGGKEPHLRVLYAVTESLKQFPGKQQSSSMSARGWWTARL